MPPPLRSSPRRRSRRVSPSPKSRARLRESLEQRVRADVISKIYYGSNRKRSPACSAAKTREECALKSPTCEWAPTPYLGRLFSSYGKCREVPIFELYVRAVCTADLEGYEGAELYKNELKKISQRFGYTLEDFLDSAQTSQGWKGVTRKQICERVKKDILKASELISSAGSGEKASADAVKKALGMESPSKSETFEKLLKYASYKAIKTGNFYDAISYIIQFLKENEIFVITNVFAICFLVYGVYELYSYYSYTTFSPYIKTGEERSLPSIQVEGVVPVSYEEKGDVSGEGGGYRSSIMDFYGTEKAFDFFVQKPAGALKVSSLVEFSDLQKQTQCSPLLNELAETEMMTNPALLSAAGGGAGAGAGPPPTTSAAAAASQQGRKTSPSPKATEITTPRGGRRLPTPEGLEDYEKICKLGIQNERQFIQDVISDIERNGGNNLADTEDFKKWGLLPGQPIFYRGAFGTQYLSHYGVYVGKGIVAEVGMGPGACGKALEMKSSLIAKQKAQSTGLNTLEDFVTRGRGGPSGREEIIFISSPDDAKKETAIERLKRIPNFIGEMSYNALTNNCEGFANAVAFGMEAKTGSMQVRIALLLATFVFTATDNAVFFLKNKWARSRKQQQKPKLQEEEE